MAAKIRVHELARELGLTNKECLDLSLKLGIGVKTHSSGIEEAQADRVRRRAEREGMVRAVQPEEPKPVSKPSSAPARSEPAKAKARAQGAGERRPRARRAAGPRPRAAAGRGPGRRCGGPRARIGAAHPAGRYRSRALPPGPRPGRRAVRGLEPAPVVAARGAAPAHVGSPDTAAASGPVGDLVGQRAPAAPAPS